MIIFGWRSTHIKTDQLNNTTCPNCNKKGGIICSIYGRYIHIFWIPLFPIGKKGATQCSKCNRSISPREMTEDFKRDYKNFKSEARRPIWHLLGIIIITIIVAFFTFLITTNTNREVEYIANPVVGDVYRCNTDVKKYTTLKVTDVKEDSIYFLKNNYSFSTRIGIEKIDLDSCYNAEVSVMSKAVLKKLYDLGTIYNVNRK